MTEDGEVDDEDAHILIDFKQQVTFIRLIDNVFVPSVIDLNAELLPTVSLDDDEFEIALTKVRFWLETVASRCIVFARGNESALTMLLDDEGRNRCGNLFMLTPYAPLDDHIAALFQAKLTALSNNAIVFGAVEVRSSNMSGLAFRFIGNAEDVMPSMEDWIGDRSYFDDPWWMRDDASTLDVIPPVGADLSKKPSWAYKLDFLGQAIRPTQDVVLHHDFRPTVINGGKIDD